MKIGFSYRLVINRKEMHEYFRIKESVQAIIREAGFKEVFEEIRPDVFGSAFSEYLSDDFRLRLIWDGKDGIGYVQFRDKDQWKDIPCYIPEAQDNEFEKNLRQLQTELKKVITNDRINT